MESGERPRRQTPGRRETDEILSYRVDQLEKQSEIFAPTAGIVALHSYKLDEQGERMDAFEKALDKAHESVDRLVLKVEGMQVRLALVVGLGSLLGGAAVTLGIALVTK